MSHNATVESGTGALQVPQTTKSHFPVKYDTECFRRHRLLHRGERKRRNLLRRCDATQVQHSWHNASQQKSVCQVAAATFRALWQSTRKGGGRVEVSRVEGSDLRGVRKRMRSSRSQLVCLTVRSPAVVVAMLLLYLPPMLADRKCTPAAARIVRRHVPLDAGCSQNPGERKVMRWRLWEGVCGGSEGVNSRSDACDWLARRKLLIDKNRRSNSFHDKKDEKQTGQKIQWRTETKSMAGAMQQKI